MYNKLERRGYSGKYLFKYFLKFCTRYPATTKYSVADGESLWLMIENYNVTKSCCIYDYDAIKDIVQPCKIYLTDVYCKEKTQVRKPCTVRLENIHSKVHNKLSSENNLHVLPKV